MDTFKLFFTVLNERECAQSHSIEVATLSKPSQKPVSGHNLHLRHESALFCTRSCGACNNLEPYQCG